MVAEGSYLVVFDTVVDDIPTDVFPDCSWGGKKNPKSAVKEFLEENDRFIIEEDIENKLLITVAQVVI